MTWNDRTKVISVRSMTLILTMVHDPEWKILKINILGCLTLIPGGLEITENDLIYVNSSVIVAIGESKECFLSHEIHPNISYLGKIP